MPAGDAPVGDAALRRPSGWPFAILVLIGLALLSGRCAAIDNPDRPDPVAAFEARCLPFESRVDQASTTAEFGRAFGDYDRFLDQELGQAYNALAAALPAPGPKQALERTQQAWAQFRDAESRFIADNWTREQFGSSSQISRGQYRVAVVKARVIQLLHYLANY
jgi:uncharacterized protein YecT (DUF1311 family)